MTKPYLSIILPVFNEEKRILNGLKSVQRFFEKKPYPYEVLIVNNGSQDKTQEIALRFIKKKKNWLFISLPYPAKGEAVKNGFLKARGEYVLFTDIDLPISLEQLGKFLGAIRRSDIAIASKFLPESYSLKPISSARRLASRTFNLLSKKLLKLPFADTQCGFKLFKRKPALPIFRGLKTKGLCFDVELLLGAQNMGLKIEEIPVKWDNSRGSNIRLGRMSFLMFLDLLKLWIRQKNF